MATLFDELNSLGKANASLGHGGKRRSIPYNEFFGEMYLEPEEKEKRIEMANALDDVFLFMFAALALFADTGDITLPVIYEMAERRYKDAIEPFLTAKALESMEIDNIIANQVRYIVDNTLAHINEPYYTSEDRAQFIAENQTNMVQNQVLEEEAMANGATHKVWVTMHDNHVRPDHQDADGQRVRIGTPFTVGDSMLMHPCDDSLGASAEQIVNCRCVVEYTNEQEEIVMTRAKDEYRKEIRAISDTRFMQITEQARKAGATFIRGTEDAERHLDNNNADAATIGTVMVFRKQVTASEAAEESYHVLQNIRGLNSDKPEKLMYILNEIDAQQYLISNASGLGIPRHETEQTVKMLRKYEEDLAKYNETYGTDY